MALDAEANIGRADGREGELRIQRVNPAPLLLRFRRTHDRIEVASSWVTLNPFHLIQAGQIGQRLQTELVQE